MRSQVLYIDNKWHPCYFFWKPDQQDGYLSNWFHSEFCIKDFDTVDEIWFTCSEQYFMWQKANVFHDAIIAKEILNIEYRPSDYKYLGQQVHNFDQKIWEENKYQIMFDANYYKFTQNPELKSELLFTEDAILAEASPYDKIWGIGLSTQGIKGLYQDIGAWKGENLLGKVLMDVREKIRREET